MAIFRPHPEDSSRAFFNWAHWGVGSSAHMLAGSFVKMLIIKTTFTRTNRIRTSYEYVLACSLALSMIQVPS